MYFPVCTQINDPFLIFECVFKNLKLQSGAVYEVIILAKKYIIFRKSFKFREP